MAQYMGRIEGNRGEASRLGSKKSGLKATVNSWNIGCIVEIKHENEHDHVYVYKTGGSNDKEKRNLVADWYERHE